MDDILDVDALNKMMLLLVEIFIGLIVVAQVCFSLAFDPTKLVSYSSMNENLVGYGLNKIRLRKQWLENYFQVYILVLMEFLRFS